MGRCHRGTQDLPGPHGCCSRVRSSTRGLVLCGAQARNVPSTLMVLPPAAFFEADA